MQSSHQSRQKGWHLVALGHLLSRHKIHLTQGAAAQIAYIYNAIRKMSPSSLDHLEILRLFDEALINSANFKIGRQVLSIIDLFYGSAIIGIKLSSETKTHHIWVSHIHSHLPEASDYHAKIQDALIIERIVFRGLGSRVIPPLEEAPSIYARLLHPLDDVSLERFAASYLLMASTGAGDSEMLLQVLSQRLGSSFQEKSLSVIEYLRSFPMTHSFIEGAEVTRMLENNIYNFIVGSESRFSLDAWVMNRIRIAISDYLSDTGVRIQPRQKEHMRFYFSDEQIRKIVYCNTITRFKALCPGDEWPDGHPCNTILKDLSIYQLDLDWIEPKLASLETIRKKNLLRAWVMEVVFKDRDKSDLIIGQLQVLATEGWLKVINSKEELQVSVSGFMLKYDTTNHLMTKIKDCFEAYLSINKPSLRLLEHLKESANTDVAHSLANALIYSRYMQITAVLMRRLCKEPSYDENLFLNLDRYVTTHLKKQLDVLFDLSVIKNEMSISRKALTLTLLSRPDQLDSFTLLVYNLMETLHLLGLNHISEQLPDFYQEIINRVYVSTDVLDRLQAICYDQNPKSVEGIPIFETIDVAKKLIRVVIDEAVDNQSIVLSDDDINNLKKFYRVYRMTMLTSGPNYGALNRLFSPKPTGAASPVTASLNHLSLS